jgi:hypothetical protein
MEYLYCPVKNITFLIWLHMDDTKCLQVKQTKSVERVVGQSKWPWQGKLIVPYYSNIIWLFDTHIRIREVSDLYLGPDTGLLTYSLFSSVPSNKFWNNALN